MTGTKRICVNGSIEAAQPVGVPSRSRGSDVIHRHSRSFSIASRLLPLRIRGSVERLYAWCRTVDDSVDEATDNAVALQVLAQLENDLDRVEVGESPLHLASLWIEPMIVNRTIDIKHAKELIAGMRMDIQGFRFTDENDLLNYCYHAAGTVGLMMLRLMGVNDPVADKHAVALGIAMQLTNIARDVHEDALRGRSYLPAAPDPLSADREVVRASVREILEAADRQYEIAGNGIVYLPRDCRLAIRMALGLYRAIGREVAARGYDVFAGRTIVPRTTLLMIVALTIVRSFAGDVRDAWDSRRFIKGLAFPCTALFGCSASINRLFSKATHAFYRRSGVVESFFGLLGRSVKKMKMNNRPSVTVSSVEQSKHAVFLGLSLTAIMATALFIMVFVNPKDESYSYTPLVYSIASSIAAILFNRLAANCEAKMRREVARN